MILNKLLKKEIGRKKRKNDELIGLGFETIFLGIFFSLFCVIASIELGIMSFVSFLTLGSILIVMGLSPGKRNFLSFVIAFLTTFILISFFDGSLFGLSWWILSIIAFILMEAIYWIEPKKKISKREIKEHILKKKLESLVEGILLIGGINLIWRGIKKLEILWKYIVRFVKYLVASFERLINYLVSVLDEILEVLMAIGKVALIILAICFVVYVWYKLNELKHNNWLKRWWRKVRK